MKARNWETRGFHHSLKTAEAIVYFAKGHAVAHQLSNTGTFFYYFQAALPFVSLRMLPLMVHFFFGGYSENSFLMSLGSFSEIFDGLLSSSR
jgi:TRAP-type mannitol/chloroaromatic compound transport system permease large subunit